MARNANKATSLGKRVLLVEDESLIAMLIEDMLIELSFEVVGIAAHVDSARALVEQIAFDFAILDVNLAGQESFHLAALLKANANLNWVCGRNCEAGLGRSNPDEALSAGRFSEGDLLVRSTTCKQRPIGNRLKFSSP
jgi:CheY-like chemotaxis protein